MPKFLKKRSPDGNLNRVDSNLSFILIKRCLHPAKERDFNMCCSVFSISFSFVLSQLMKQWKDGKDRNGKRYLENLNLESKDCI